MLAKKLTDSVFVLREGVGVQETDRDRFDTLAFEPRLDLPEFLLVDRLDDFTRGRDAFVDFESKVTFDERARLGPEDIVHLWRPNATQLKHIAEALRGHKRGVCAAVFEYGVRGNGSPVSNLRDGFARTLRFLQQERDCDQYGLLIVWGRGGEFICPDFA